MESVMGAAESALSGLGDGEKEDEDDKPVIDLLSTSERAAANRMEDAIRNLLSRLIGVDHSKSPIAPELHEMTESVAAWKKLHRR
jgi:hypothetical protein